MSGSNSAAAVGSPASMAFRIRVTSAMPPSISRAGPPGDRKTGPAVPPSAATSGGLPAPSRGPPVGEEAAELPRRETQEPAERLLQVAEWVEPEPPAGADHRVQHRGRAPAPIAPGEQVVLAADGDGPQRPLAGVV